MGFDEKAASWDSAECIERARRIAAEIRQHIAAPGGMGMEFGCGTGLVGLALADCFARITFVDTSEGMLAVLREKIAREGCQNATAARVDLAAEPLSDLRFDCIFSSMALHHVADAPGMLSRLASLLNPGGQLLLVDLDRDPAGAFHAEDLSFDGYHGFDQADIMDWARAAGLREVACHTFYRDERQIAGVIVPYSLFLLRGEK